MLTEELHRIYMQLVSFITSRPTIEDLAQFQLSSENEAYISALLEANQNRRLSDAEAATLQEYDRIEHLLTMIKLTALEALQGQNNNQDQAANIATSTK